MVASDENSKNSMAMCGEDDIDLANAALDFRNKYDVRERLGKGLSSVVYGCVDKNSGKQYAVKMMDISQDHTNADGMGIIQQIHEEIRLLNLVEGHRFIIKLIDVYESPAFIFLVFELCENDLFEYLSENVSLSEKKCRAIMKQVFEAVHHCHQKNVIHRDIKPENILLDKDLDTKLTDFGLAREIRNEERLYECVGTPGYLAPEVLEAGMCERNECNGYSFEVDAWACGVVMYTLLVGTPPFWHHRQLNMIRLIMRGNYSMEGPAWKSVTAETKDLIRKLLVVNPKDRLTIEQALQHEVFHAQRFTRVAGELLCVVHEEVLDENIDECDHGGNGNDNNQNDNNQIETTRENNTTTTTDHQNLSVSRKTKSFQELVSPMMSAKRRWSVIKRRTSIVPQVIFDPRKTFKTAITCVRFLVRLKHIRTTPVLLSLEQTRVKPYTMRNYRRSIDRHAFGLYNHWIKKDQAQDRAAVFQTSPKRDMKTKNKSSSF